MANCCGLRPMLAALGTVASYWGLCILIALTNPPARILDILTYAGAPIGDRSEEFRVAAATMGSDVPGVANLTWGIDTEACGFRYNWATDTGVVGTQVDLTDDFLCTYEQTPDFYAVEGVTKLSPFYDPSLAEDEPHTSGIFTWYKWSDIDLLRHIYPIGTITSEHLKLSVAVPSEAFVELFLSVVDIRGPHSQANSWVNCYMQDSMSTTAIDWAADCEVVFDFWGDQSTETRNTTAEVTEAILGLLNDLAQSDSPPLGFTGKDLSDGVCQELERSMDVVACLIDCFPAYPYGAGVCSGSYSVPRGGSLPGQLWGVVFLAATALAMVIYIAVGRVGGSVNGGIAYLGRYAPTCTPPPPPPPYDIGNGELVELALPRRRTKTWATAEAHPPTASCPPLDLASDVGRTLRLGEGPPHPLGTNVVLKPSEKLDLKYVQSLSKPILTLSEDRGGNFRNIRSSEIDKWFDAQAAVLVREAVANDSHFEWRQLFSVEKALGGVMLLWTTWWVTASSGWGAFYWLTALVFAWRMREETDVANLWMSLRYGAAYLPRKTVTGGVLPLLLAFMELATDAKLPGSSLIGLVIAVITTGVMLGATCRYVWLYGHNPRSGTPWVVPRTPEEVAVFHAYTGSVLVFFGRWTGCLRCGDIGGELATMLCLADTGSPAGVIGHVFARTQLSPAKGKATVAGHLPETLSICQASEQE